MAILALEIPLMHTDKQQPNLASPLAKVTILHLLQLLDMVVLALVSIGVEVVEVTSVMVSMVITIVVHQLEELLMSVELLEVLVMDAIHHLDKVTVADLAAVVVET